MSIRKDKDGANTDPTYKEWKQLKMLEIYPVTVFRHGSYLQGMETILKNYGKQSLNISRHGSYLQGMETSSGAYWLQAPEATRILPTRNGNM